MLLRWKVLAPIWQIFTEAVNCCSLCVQ